MRKRIIAQPEQSDAAQAASWLNLEQVAQVEVTSEDPAHPVEGALLPRHRGSWRAAAPGEQKIRLLFDEPQRLRRIQLRFVETHDQRTQEFVLRWAGDPIDQSQEILRQQFCFSPPGTTTENEDYSVELEGVRLLEISILPDIGQHRAFASLERLRLSSE